MNRLSDVIEAARKSPIAIRDVGQAVLQERDRRLEQLDANLKRITGKLREKIQLEMHPRAFIGLNREIAAIHAQREQVYETADGARSTLDGMAQMLGSEELKPGDIDPAVDRMELTLEMNIPDGGFSPALRSIAVVAVRQAVLRLGVQWTEQEFFRAVNQLFHELEEGPRNQ